ncbi:MAG TPA: DUF1761 domain-containing protein [Candidatus Paceibacterota bacterium]
MTIFLLALAGTVLSMIVGTFWFMPQTPMGRLHMKYLGFDKLSHEEQKRKIEEAKPTMPKTYAGQAVLSFLTSLAVVFIVTMSMQNGVPREGALGFIVLNWLCFMVPVAGANVLWGPVDRAIAWKKFISDIGWQLAVVLVVGIMASVFAV